MNYYNEHDPKAAAWLQELINQKLIPEGYVDTRSITEVTPADLHPYIQCHFFAGIGGWSYALQLAGIPANTRLWTGSCPCQPFSTAGKGLAQQDERHLWPVFFDLIRQCCPEHVFGEQVASAIGHGWLDGISTDLEAEGYACGAAVLGAHSVSAPHQRQRLYWVADATERQRTQLSNSPSQGHESRPANGGALRMGNSVRAGWEGAFDVSSGKQSSECEPRYKRIVGADGKARRIPVEPELYPLAYGLSGRVGLLRGYGNAIVPQVAAEFIRAFYETQIQEANTDFC